VLLVLVVLVVVVVLLVVVLVVLVVVVVMLVVVVVVGIILVVVVVVLVVVVVVVLVVLVLLWRNAARGAVARRTISMGVWGAVRLGRRRARRLLLLSVRAFAERPLRRGGVQCCFAAFCRLRRLALKPLLLLPPLLGVHLRVVLALLVHLDLLGQGGPVLIPD
jgi:hypothetical protein